MRSAGGNSMIDQVIDFVRGRFERFPHFSFGDPRIMIDHSLEVHAIACELSEEADCSRCLVEICALLHDIGKTAQEDLVTLEKHHERLGWIVSAGFLRSLALKPEQLKAVRDFFDGRPSTERAIVKEADIAAFFLDPVLQSAYVKWAEENGKTALIPGKWEKFDQLRLPRAKELCARAWQGSREKWRGACPGAPWKSS